VSSGDFAMKADQVRNDSFITATVIFYPHTS
jgi:hypothetical protein